MNIDYRKWNFCRPCKLKVDKDKIHCPQCGLKVRKLPKRKHSKRMTEIYEQKIRRIK